MAEHVPSKNKVIKDPIHGQIELPELCVRIMDTPQFQRLRSIRQLGATYHVYPGASHHRFEHSLGVCHLAGKMVKHLQREQPELGITDRDVLCVQVAGLCHDLGHGPFSHVFDGHIIAALKPEVKWTHERGSIDMLEHLLTDNKIALSDYHLDDPTDRCFIKELIFGPLDGETYTGRAGMKTFLYQIVANKNTGIDVDKWDYFARDCHFLGFQSMFDHARLMQFARVIKSAVDEWNICFRDKEVSNVYDMFHTRQILHRRAYQHKTTKAVEKMISEAFIAADPYIVIDGRSGDPIHMSECINDMRAFTRLTDHVYSTILFSTDPELTTARNILERIEKRKLYKCVAHTKPKKGREWGKVQESSIEETLLTLDASLFRTDIVIVTLKFDYGMKGVDPVGGVKFYTKYNPDTAKSMPRNKVSHMLPESFEDKVICCYSRSANPDVNERTKRCFVECCQLNDSLQNVDIDL